MLCLTAPAISGDGGDGAINQYAIAGKIGPNGTKNGLLINR